MSYSPEKNLVLHQQCLGLWQATKYLRGAGEHEMADRLEDSQWAELKDCYVYATDREERLEELRKQKKDLLYSYTMNLHMTEEKFRSKFDPLVVQIKEVESTPKQAPHSPQWWPNRGERPVLVCERCFIEPLPERFFPEMLKELHV